MAEKHQHSWFEFSRNFPLGDLAQDPDWLSPDGGHVPGHQDGTLIPSSHAKLAGKVPPNRAYVALQCSDPDCRHVEHVDLTKAEWSKVEKAYRLGAFDPDANGTHRLLSQLSLDELDLGRIADRLDDDARALSGAVESLADADGSRFVSGDDSAVNARARETMGRALGLEPKQGGRSSTKGGSGS